MRNIIGSFLSTLAEWYSFFLFSQLSFVIFPFYIFILGFIFRFLGGIIFGYLGDRINRKIALIIINLLISIFSLLLFFFLNTFTLISYRVIQGLTLGGEWGGASTILLEAYAKSKMRGFILSLIQLTVPLAIILSSISILVDWKISLLVISAISLISIPLISESMTVSEKTNFPLLDAIKEDWDGILKAIGIKVSESAIFYLFTSYVFYLGYKVTGIVIIATSLQLFLIPFFGYLSDIIGRKRVEYIGLSFLIFSLPFFPNFLGEVFMSISDSALYAPQSSIFTEIFKKKYRYTASSISYQLASLIGGTIPSILLYSLKANLFLVILPFLLVSFISLLIISETKSIYPR
ncbi:MFS transporter [Sulfurisphaera javensis]|uniref:MFS transporter n=1 Tax=Sulfurisphaera javensis TaxID=2049879 RepID=A0AAT9GUL9_9CREN